ncbi:hypothetical protein GJ654_15065 [Rhodoblastus acidophilus]|uniref:Uncharacterized protein n=1 Tax=Rhodoblastus acidophilus TaxID=1074 RepID=A0A6N8DPS8_RHOAC|nr:hypothetical protein [Rhodoblastus acidophilus]
MVVAGVVGVLAFSALVYWAITRRIRRRDFIDDFGWPPGLIDRFRKRRPGLSPADVARVELGLRQFFRAYLSGGRAYVAMPSQVVDDLWHEFILFTRAYQDFCQKAFGGFLHHTPALALKPAQRESNAGLRRVWSACCAEEAINPRKPDRLPLLFALDAQLRIADGFRYSTDCRALRDRGVASAYCGGDFSDSSVDGTTSGLGGGDGDGHGGGDGGGDGGSSCGGGCGGGD